MKKLLATLLILVACIHVNAQESRQIRISTDRTDLILEVAPDGRLYQSYLGDRLLNEQDLKNLSGSSRGWEVYPGSGGEDYFEPAVAITNNDAISARSCVMYLRNRKLWKVEQKPSSG